MAIGREIVASKPSCSALDGGWRRYGNARFATSARLPWKDAWIDSRTGSGVGGVDGLQLFQR